MIKRLRNCNGQTWFKTGLFGQSYLSEGDKALWQSNFKSRITFYESNPAKRMIILETTQCATLYDYIFMNLKQLPFWGIAIPRKTGRTISLYRSSKARAKRWVQHTKIKLSDRPGLTKLWYHKSRLQSAMCIWDIPNIINFAHFTWQLEHLLGLWDLYID